MIIELQNIKKNYRLGTNDYQALKGIDMQVEKGEFIAIMGPSGSGKSTLMNIIGALDTASSGKYILDEIDTESLSDDKLASFRNKRIGFVFQQFNLLKSVSVFDNVALPAKYGGLKQIDQRVMEVLDAVGLSDKHANRPNQLSGGQMQRVAIARSLVMNPAIILADEPTGNLDSRTGESIMDIFTELHDRGNTIIMITHEDEIAAYAERQVILRDGLIVND